MNILIEEIKKTKKSVIIANQSIIDKVKIQLSTTFNNVKYVSFNQLKEDFFGNYSKKALFLLSKENKLPLEICDIFLKNSLLIDSTSNNSKINNLYEIKKQYHKYLDIFEKQINNYIGKKIFVVNYYDDDSFVNKALMKISKFCNIKRYNTFNKKRTDLVIKEFNSINEEVFNCVNEISKLIINGVDINKIKINNVNSEYLSVFKEAFKMYNIDYSQNTKTSLFEIEFTKKYLNLLNDYLDCSLYEALLNIKELLLENNISDEEIEILNLITKGLNELVILDDNDHLNIRDLQEIIKYTLKGLKYSKSKYQNVVCFENVIDTIYDDSYHLFVLNFNQDVLPVVYKDDDFLTDLEKKELELVQTVTKNIASKKKMVDFINNNSNIYISYALKGLDSYMIKSGLISDLSKMMNIDVINTKLSLQDITNFDYARLKYLKEYEDYLKFNHISDIVLEGYKTFNDCSSDKYDNSFTGIDKDVLSSYINDCKLSYSTIDYLFKCPFSYYVSQILKIKKDGQDQSDNINLFVGSLFHYCLERLIETNSENYEEDIYKFSLEYLDNNDFVLTAKLKFYLEKFKKELGKTYSKIKDYYENSKFKVEALEKKFEVEITDKIVFKGFIDKIFKYKNYYVVIDYKTRDVSVDFHNINLGKELQLPTYIYLIKKHDKKALIGGCYLQSVLEKTPFKYDKTKTYEMQFTDSKRYQGYTNQNLEVVSSFDGNYQNKYRSLPCAVVKTDGTFTNNFINKSFSDYDFDMIAKLVEEKIDECVKTIESGNFEITVKTIDGKSFSCEYCKYKDLCFKKNKDIIDYPKSKDYNFLYKGCEDHGRD